MLRLGRRLRLPGSMVLILVMAVLLLGLQPLPVSAAAALGLRQTGPGPDAATSAATAANGENSPLQFTSAGHVLSFYRDGVMIASADHMLKAEFMHASPAVPQAESTGDADRALSRVAYKGLWSGVDLVYETSPGTILKSTYYIAAEDIAGSVEQIRLQYNRPVSLDANGSLVTAFDSGSLTESRPVAWQEVGGEKRAVQAGFQLYSDSQVGFTAADYLPGLPLVIDPAVTWSTFLGPSCSAVTVDGSGNIYVTGDSNSSWGNPVHDYIEGEALFVAKLNSSGGVVWSTFWGSYGWGNGITLDAAGNVYVTGLAATIWGDPRVDPYVGNLNGDICVAKFSSTGDLIWNTFLGDSNQNIGYDIAVDSDSNVYVSGSSPYTWGAPVDVDHGEGGVLLKLDSNGDLLWNTFMGSDVAGMVIDATSIYISGGSGSTWGDEPLNDFAGGSDISVAKFNRTNGHLTWNTFYGGAVGDYALGMTIDGSGNLYVTGEGHSWGHPVQESNGAWEGFLLKMDSSGTLIWNTFMGGEVVDACTAVAVDGSGNVYVAGHSNYPWGSPTPAFTAWEEAFVAKLDSTNGCLTWNAFLGGSNGDDAGNAIAVDNSGNIYVTGHSTATWGAPLSPFGASAKNFIAKLTNPSPVMGTSGNNHSITKGDATPSTTDNTDFGSASVSGGTVDVTFTINNTGNCSLALPGSPQVALSGATSGDFSVTDQPDSSVIAGGSTTFTIRFAPTTAGTRSATVSITNNTGGGLFTFSIKGTGTAGGGGGPLGGGASVGGSFTPVNRWLLTVPLAILGLILILGGTGLALSRRKKS
jgi:hypothetical protein